MNPNHSLSYDEKNEFMPNPPQNIDPMFEQFMKSCIANPAFFDNMKTIFASKTMVQPNPYSQQYSVGMSSNYQSQPNLINESINQQSRFDQSRSQNYQRIQEQSFANPKMEKKKPANPLLKYQPQPKEAANYQKQITKFQNQSKPIMSFDDIPINSKYNQASGNSQMAFIRDVSTLNNLKENQSINISQNKFNQFDDRPIKPMTAASEQEIIYREAERKPIKSIKTNEPDIVKNKKQDKYFEAQQRPIKGITKDFKELVKQKFPDPFQKGNLDDENYNNQDQNQQSQSTNKKTQPRNFLKRGSRQHLSSAVNRSRPHKDSQQSALNKSGLQDLKEGRSITPKNIKNQNRSISQNRVLGKRNNDKSVTKQQNKKNDESYVEQEKIKLPIKKSKQQIIPKLPTSKQSLKSSTVAQSKLTPTSIKKKKKNVFQDNSESSSQQQEKAPFFKAVSKHEETQQNLIEIVKGIFVTEEQLQQIADKYGKKVVVQQNQSQKMAALRKKYTDLCNLVEEERQKQKEAAQKQMQDFQNYKAQQMNKIKNERRVMERQVKSSQGSANLLKQKQQIQNLKKEVQKERDDFKKKQKNNKIIIDKLKKQNQELKNKLERVQIQKQNSIKNNKSYKIQQRGIDEKSSTSISTKNISSPPPSRKIEEDEQISYKDIKKGKQKQSSKNSKKQTKMKYEYVEQQPVIKNKSVSVKNDSKNDSKKSEMEKSQKWDRNRFDDTSSEQEQQQQLKENDNDSIPVWSPAMKLSDLTRIDLTIKMVTQPMINTLFRFENNIEYRLFNQTTKSPNRTIVNTTRNTRSMLTTNFYSDNSKQLIYDIGTHKFQFQNGYCIVYFQNGDIKQTLTDKTVMYFFNEKKVDQITLTNGVNIFRFENNQVQFHFNKGQYIEIRHNDGTIKTTGNANYK